MLKIRKSVFETNSSSTHSICVAVGSDLVFPESVTFRFGEFGWEHNILMSVEEKASYLYTAIYALGRMDVLEKVKEVLSGNNIDYVMEQYQENEVTAPNGYKFTEDNAGYIDHADELSEFLDALLYEGELLSFLLSPGSFIRTGNDNDDSDVSIFATYPHNKYYKGN